MDGSVLVLLSGLQLAVNYQNIQIQSKSFTVMGSDFGVY